MNIYELVLSSQPVIPPQILSQWQNTRGWLSHYCCTSLKARMDLPTLEDCWNARQMRKHVTSAEIQSRLRKSGWETKYFTFCGAQKTRRRLVSSNETRTLGPTRLLSINFLRTLLESALLILGRISRYTAIFSPWSITSSTWSAARSCECLRYMDINEAYVNGVLMLTWSDDQAAVWMRQNVCHWQSE